MLNRNYLIDLGLRIFSEATEKLKQKAKDKFLND